MLRRTFLGVSLLAASGGLAYHIKTNSNVIPVGKGCAFLTYFSDGNINAFTFDRFKRKLRRVNPDEDIIVRIETDGGDYSFSEFIARTLLSMKDSKTIARVENRALSGGSMIALCCDEIEMKKGAFLSPCDVQIELENEHVPVSNFIQPDFYSEVSAEKIIEKKGEAIDNETINNLRSAERIIRGQRNFVKLLRLNGKCENNCKTIYDEFFSGKHKHDKFFGIEDLRTMGLKVKEI